MSESKIEWTDATWNPVRGCSLVSKGCANCYAMKFAHRFSGEGGRYEGLTELGPQGPRWAGRARFVPEMLAAPLSWKRPRLVFVNSMSDLFHEDVTDEQIAAVFGVMAACQGHTFQILTKRQERARDWFRWIKRHAAPYTTPVAGCVHYAQRFSEAPQLRRTEDFPFWTWPLPNVLLGVSCEDQATADARIPVLLDIPAAVRFVSAEPLLGRLNISRWLTGDETGHETGGPQGWVDGPALDWVIAGGESGPGARPCALEWIEDIVDQCRQAFVPVFVKQVGSYVVSEGRAYDTDEEAKREGFGSRWLWRAKLADRKGGDPSEWPDTLDVRQFPTPQASVLPEKEDVPPQTQGIAGR